MGLLRNPPMQLIKLRQGRQKGLFREFHRFDSSPVLSGCSFLAFSSSLPGRTGSMGASYPEEQYQLGPFAALLGYCQHSYSPWSIASFSGLGPSSGVWDGKGTRGKYTLLAEKLHCFPHRAAPETFETNSTGNTGICDSCSSFCC